MVSEGEIRLDGTELHQIAHYLLPYTFECEEWGGILKGILAGWKSDMERHRRVLVLNRPYKGGGVGM